MKGGHYMQLKGKRDFGNDMIFTISISEKEFKLIYDTIFEKCQRLSQMQKILTDDDKELYKRLKIVIRGMDLCLNWH